MDLFRPNPTENLLPFEGLVNYYGPILDHRQCSHFENALSKSVPWAHDEVVMFGKRITTARKVAWYADSNSPYSYSSVTHQPLPWNPELREIKKLIEKLTATAYDSCLLNLYHDGNEGMGWHSDDEKSLARHAPIASLSLGAERPFRFRHKKNGETISIKLEPGSLLLMKGETQTHWKHCLPKTKKVHHSRINLTFRTMKEPSP